MKLFFSELSSGWYIFVLNAHTMYGSTVTLGYTRVFFFLHSDSLGWENRIDRSIGAHILTKYPYKMGRPFRRVTPIRGKLSLASQFE